MGEREADDTVETKQREGGRQSEDDCGDEDEEGKVSWGLGEQAGDGEREGDGGDKPDQQEFAKAASDARFDDGCW